MTDREDKSRDMEAAEQVAPGVSDDVESSSVRQQRRNDYNRLVRTAKLVSLIMEKVDFKISPESMAVSKSLLSRSLAASVEMLASGFDDNTCVANVIWSVKLNYKKKNVARCSASYLVSYEGMKGFPEEVIEIYADTNAKAAAYAYFRALFAQLDWSANLGSPPLPIVQLQAQV